MNAITNLPTAQISAGNNDRKDFDPIKLRELAFSIQVNGLAQPITVRPIASLIGTTYEIVAGERRFRAISQILEWETIPAIIRELDDAQASAIMLVENTGRADLNPIEEAKAYQDRIDRFNWPIEHIASIAGKSEDLIKRRLSLLSLIPDVQHLLQNNHFPIGHAESLAGLDANRQRIAIRIYRESKNGLPLTQFRGIVSQLLEEQSQDALFDLESFWVEQVQQGVELPKRGKRAVTGAPTRNDLPPIEATGKDNVGSILDRHIAQLQNAGHAAEAAAIGNVYDTLVHGNWASVPNKSDLL